MSQSTNAETPSRRRLPTIEEMIGSLAGIQGQGDAKQRLCTAVYTHYLSQVIRRESGEELAPQHTLLIGPSGSGKSLLVNTLADVLGVPFYRIAATSLVEVGYKGMTVDEAIHNYCLQECRGRAALAENGIVFIDECDKIASRGGDDVRDVSGTGVQNALLTLLDGRLSESQGGQFQPRVEPVNTRRILFVFAGAFAGLGPIIRRRLRLGQRRIGWEGTVRGASFPTEGEVLRQVSTEDLIEFGFIRELAGRFANLASLDSLSTDDLQKILSSDSAASALGTQVRLARAHGIDLRIDPPALHVLAMRAQELGIGARGLNRVVGDLLAELVPRWPQLAERGVDRVMIDARVARREIPPQEHRSEERMYLRRDEALREWALAEGAPVSAKGQESSTSRVMEEDDSRRSLDSQRARLRAVRVELGWKQASRTTRRWWSSLIRRKPEEAAQVSVRLEELGATLQEYHAAARVCGWKAEKALVFLEVSRAEPATLTESDDLFDDLFDEFLKDSEPADHGSASSDVPF